MESARPTGSQGLLFGEAGECDPSLTGVEDDAVGLGGPGDLRIEFDCVAVMVFAFGEGLFGLLAASDIDNRDGDADDLVGFIARRLVRSEEGACDAWITRIGIVDFNV